MRINEVVNEGIISGISNIAKGVADVAGRGIMQKYGGTSGGTYNIGATASTAQGLATKLSDPVVQKLATSIKATFKRDVQNLLKTARSADNTPVTSSSQLEPADIKQALLGEVAKMIGFDYNKLGSIVDPAAGSGTGTEMSKTVQDTITRSIDSITAAEANPTPANIKLQDQAWLVLAQNVQSAKSMAEFNRSQTSTAGLVQSPQGKEIQRKADTAGLTPDKLGINPSIRDPKTIQALSAMGFKIS